MRRAVFAFCLLLGAVAVVCAEPPAVEDIDAGRAKVAFLAAELDLARKNAFYIVFDFEKSEIQLRARGTVFRTWPIRTFRFGGNGLPLAPLALEDRVAPNAPTRTIIKPPDPAEVNADGSEEETPYKEPDPFEVVDMPTRYRLKFEKGIAVAVFSYPPQSDYWFRRAAHAVAWNASLALRRFRGDKTLLVELTLNPEDAQFFYWALVDRMQALFWDPRY